MKVRSNKIKDILKYYSSQLAEYYDKKEAANLVSLVVQHYLNLSKNQLVLNYDKPVNESDMLKIHFAYRDLKNQKPVQYIFGETEFYELKFKVNEAVLIPRSETEELVEWIIKDYENNTDSLKILDIGAGSGAIAIALKKNMPNSEVTAIDVSEKAIETAKQNSELNRAEVDFRLFDILDFSKHKELQSFDVIVSNPPYVRKSEKEKMQKNVLDYEPENALFVEDSNPLEFYDVIADFAKTNLLPNGKLYFEINEAFGKQTKELLANKGFSNVEIRKDINERDRMVSCCLFT